MEHFGKKAKDKITGFEGIVTGTAQHMHGPLQLFITPIAKDNKFVDGRWIEFERIEFLE